MRPGEGITGSAAAARAPVMLESQAHLDPRFKNFPNLPEDEYESILAVPILTRDGTLEGALNVRTREPRAFVDDEVELLLAIAAQVAQSIEHAKLYAEAQRRVHELEALARISEAVSNSLYLEESLEAIVKTTMDALVGDRRRARARRRPHRVAGGRRAARMRCASRCAGAAARSASSSPTARRRSPTADGELLASIATHAAVALEHGRAVMRGVLAQEIHHRVKNNLQTVASLLRLQARSGDTIDPREALEHSVNRILAIAAVHELLTERRDEDVELGRPDRPAARDARAGRRRRQGGHVGARDRWRSRAPARPRSRSSSPSCCRTRSSTAATACSVELARRDGDVVLAIADDGAGRRRGRRPAPASRSCSALVRDELRGTLDLRSDGGTRAEVVFPGLERVVDAAAAGGRAVDGRRRSGRQHFATHEPCAFELLQGERERARRDAGERDAELGEAAALAELGEHRDRPLAEQQSSWSPRGEHAASRRSPPASPVAVGQVLRPQRVAVAGVAPDEALVDQRVERARAATRARRRAGAAARRTARPRARRAARAPAAPSGGERARSGRRVDMKQ